MIRRKAAVEEVTALAVVEDQGLHEELLSKFIDYINQSVILDLALLDGLALVISYANPKLVNADNLVQILKVLQQRVEKTHAGDEAKKLNHILRSISRLLDAMVDANVAGLSRVEQQEPLYDKFGMLLRHPNQRLAFQARYAQQALVRIPNDEKKLHSILRRLWAVSGGLVSLKKAVFNLDPSALVSAFKLFNEAVKHAGPRRIWYDGLRYAELLLEADNFKGFEFFIRNANCRTDEFFMFGVTQQLRQVAHRHADLTIRQQALSMLGQFFKEDSAWGKHTLVNEEILKILTEEAQSPEGVIRKVAVTILQQLKKEGQSHQRKLLDALPEFSKLATRQTKPPRRFSTKLIRMVQQEFASMTSPLVLMSSGLLGSPTAAGSMPVLLRMPSSLDPDRTLMAKIKQRQTAVLEDKALQKDLEIYIPVRGAYYRSQERDAFDLEIRVQEFLQSSQRVLLLLGTAGSGKSTFNRFIEKRLWQDYEPGKRIPLFISLPSISHPETDLLTKHFTRLGFSSREIAILKAKYSFVFILDGYDEMEDVIKERMLVNLYQTNHLEDWDARTVIACRTDCSVIKTGNYSQYFVPFQQEKRQGDLLLELTTVPFSDVQVEAYINKYLAINRNTDKAPWKIAEEYLSRCLAKAERRQYEGKGPPWGKTEDDYKSYLNTCRKLKTELSQEKAWTAERFMTYIREISGLRALIETPFVLMVMMDIMARVMLEHAHVTDAAERGRLTSAVLYDKFVQAWFEREEDKLAARNLLPRDGHDVKRDFFTFAGDLAVAMHEAKVMQVDYYGESRDIWGHRRASPWDKFFGKHANLEINENIVRARRACPLKRVGPRYAFMHAELLDYFCNWVQLQEELESTESAAVMSSSTKRPSVADTLPFSTFAHSSMSAASTVRVGSTEEKQKVAVVTPGGAPG